MARTAPLTQILVLTLALTLAGCMDEKDADPGTEPTHDANAGADGPSKTDASSTTPPTGTNATPTPQPFQWDGSLSALAGGCFVVTCTFQGAGTWDGSTKLSGLTSADLTLSWDSATTPELAFGLATACDGPCDFVGFAQSASPVTLSLDDLDPATTYTLVVWHPYQCMPVVCLVGVQAGTQMDFHVEGTLTAV